MAFDSVFNALAGWADTGGQTFECQLRCYSMAASGKAEKEHGDKVILPESKFQTLSMMNVQWPIQFRVSNESCGRATHVGVLEFTAPEGRAYVPHWIMQNLVAEEGSLLRFANVSLPKGSFVKIRPRSSDFLDISDPKAVLEMSLRNYSCLTKDDQVCINYNSKNFFFDVLELKPADAVSIVETDMEVDFAPPADYEEPEAHKKSKGVDFNEANATTVSQNEEDTEANKSSAAVHDPNFVPFKGSGQRLDGKSRRKGSGAASPALSSASSASGSNAGGAGGQTLQSGASPSPLFGPAGGATLRDRSHGKHLEENTTRNQSPLQRAVNSGLGGSVISGGNGDEFSLGPSASSQRQATKPNSTNGQESSNRSSGLPPKKESKPGESSSSNSPNKFLGRWKKPGATFFTGEGKTLRLTC